MTKRRERQIDLGGFLETVTRGARLAESLRPGQIHHVELAHADVLLAIWADLCSLDSDLEERVRPTRVLVHGRLAHGPVLLANGHDLCHFFGALGRELGQVFHVDA